MRKMLRVTLTAVTPVAIVATTAVAQQPNAAPGARAPVAPLFAAHDPLTFTIEAPLSTIFKDRGTQRNERPSKLILTGSDGQSAKLDVAIRTRGKTRAERRICQFPPLRLDFDTAAHGTVFEKQNALKLVTHCQDDDPQYDQYVLQEYLVYRAYNLLTDLSFKPRLARVTYVDTDGRRATVTRYAFLLEDDDDMAARNAWQALTVRTIPLQAVDPQSVALLGVFQYMIGNPDWSLVTVEPGEDACCHNTVPIGAASGPIFLVPFDFDITGIVNPRYADRLFEARQRNLGIRRVRERVYRGLCAADELLPSTFELFNQKRDAIYAVYREQPGLDAGVLKTTLEYLDEFYATINDPRKVRQVFAEGCSP